MAWLASFAMLVAASIREAQLRCKPIQYVCCFSVFKICMGCGIMYGWFHLCTAMQYALSIQPERQLIASNFTIGDKGKCPEHLHLPLAESLVMTAA